MAYLVADVPLTYCKVRREFLRDQRDGHGEYEDGCIIGVTAIEGRVPLFQVMMRSGALWHRLPLHALCMAPCDPLPLPALCMWDALSYHVAVHEYAYLSSLVADVFCGDGETRRGKYLFTLDWAESDYSEMPDQHKAHHLLALDAGHIVAMPNNRLRWHEPSWIKPFCDRPDYLVQTTVYTAERERAVQDGDRMFYVKDGEAPPAAGGGTITEGFPAELSMDEIMGAMRRIISEG